MDRRKFNKGSKGNKGGRPRKLDFTINIELACEKMLLGLLENDDIKNEVYSQLSKRNKISPSVEIGWVYIVRDGDMAKVGITSNVKNRLRNYKSHNPRIELIYCCKLAEPNNLEKLMLNEVNTVYGDWFKWNDEISLNLISIASNYLIS